MKNNNNLWKTVAIVFIILFTLETAYVLYATSIGTEMINNDYDCAYITCENYETYNYDSYSKICQCFENHEVVVSIKY
jgi:hypothetical protein